MKKMIKVFAERKNIVMKNSTLTRIILWSVVLVIIAAVAVYVVVSDNNGTGWVNLGFSGYRYPDASSYLVGDFSVDADEITDMDIDWVSGSITIETYDGDEITFKESSRLEEKEKMRYRIKNGKVSVKFCESGWSFGILHINKQKPKDLTIMIPRDISLDSLDFSIVSSDIDSTGAYKVRDMNIDGVSGNINIADLTADTVDIDNVSGKINFTRLATNKFTVDSVSGNCDMTGTANDFNFDMVSADITLDLDIAPRSIDVDTVSGRATIKMPETGITVDNDTLSGKTTVFGQSIKKDMTLTLGDGYTKLEIDTVSGDVTVTAK